MDINTLLGGFLPQLPKAMVGDNNVTENNTSGPHNNMHNNIVESILPLVGLRGFAPFYQFLGSWLGWDPTVLLTALGFVWAANKVFQQLYSFLIGLVEEHLMSSIHVSSGDDIYDHLMGWLSCQPKMVNSRDLMAETVSKTTWDDEDESTVARDRSGLYLNFSNQEARMVSLLPKVPLIPLFYYYPFRTTDNADMSTLLLQAAAVYPGHRPSQLLVEGSILQITSQEGIYFQRRLGHIRGQGRPHNLLPMEKPQ